jgi:NAD(P)-dependent dehydrogenase (short-subunit alcohol dehydrogenase family)
MVSVLVTGTNQGVGLALVRELNKRDDVRHIFSTVRDPTSPSCEEINALAKSSPKIHVIKLQLTEASAEVSVFYLQAH